MADAMQRDPLNAKPKAGRKARKRSTGEAMRQIRDTLKDRYRAARSKGVPDGIYDQGDRLKMAEQKRGEIGTVSSLPPPQPDEAAVDEKLSALIEAARSVEMTQEDLEKQRRSFAYGNTHIENDNITMETIAKAAKQLKESGEC